MPLSTFLRTVVMQCCLESVVNKTAFAVKAHSTLSMPKLHLIAVPFVRQQHLSAPCCNNNKAVSTQMRVTARWYSDPYLYALIKVNVRDYRSMNKNTEK